MSDRTLFDKIWDRHVVAAREDGQTLLYIDRHLCHDGSFRGFKRLRQQGRRLRRPEQTYATPDHYTPTHTASLDEIADPRSREIVTSIGSNCAEFGVHLFPWGDPRQGIAHVVGPEQGITLPGLTLVCGDSHTATHGAFGALAFGIGTSEVEHVLTTQCLLQGRPKTFEVRVEGRLEPGVSAKDIILAMIAQIGVGGGTGHVFEYTGPAVRALSMEERMTVCNMSIEGGARAGLIAPDDTTYEYLADRPYAPQGADWEVALARWRELPTDEGATYDRTVTLDASVLEPMITYGTNPGMGVPISAPIPLPDSVPDVSQRQAIIKALDYMALKPGASLLGHPIDVVFIGSCTNSRISDLRQAAELMKGRKVKDGVRTLVVPGSQQVKRQAEAEGLDRIFKEAGAEWRESGCSMCLAMNGDQLEPGQYAISTSNRNFEGRQGKGGRTFLASPLTAAAAAITGVVTDARKL